MSSMSELDARIKRNLAFFKSWVGIHYPHLKNINAIKKARVRVVSLSENCGECFSTSGDIFLDKDYLLMYPKYMTWEILGHEFCHIIADLLDPQAFHHHNATWKRIMSELGFKPVARPSFEGAE